MSAFELNRHSNAEVRVAVSSPSSSDSRDEGYVNLRVEDAASGTVLVDVEIPAGQWWRLMQSSVQTHPAFISRNLDRVGKRMENTSVSLGRVKDEAEAAAVWDEMPNPDGWDLFDTKEFRRTNMGWTVLLRRWVEATQ